MSDGESKLAQFMNLPVEIITTLDQKYKGRVFSYDDFFLILRKENSKKKNDMYFINMDCISSVSILANEEIPAVNFQMNSEIDFKLIMEREKEDINTSQKRATTVNRFAQELFDAIKKTYQIYWDHDVMKIDILGVQIKSPYDPSCVIGADDKSVNRIKQVVQNVTNKINRS
eukprot:CAMPEP_0114976794 /NCGR_PEP_ID=MMETSP0216-20121206/2874_1 /TAXON_ID=223996 /ORGANISM="Protocruzia adherens, Strain Boccale" /LENGTH=171 /DNA_ID=CAMNT_0002337769 /DNA_START=60 /DNA_END=575 /DNA_ORIENTATION=+